MEDQVKQEFVLFTDHRADGWYAVVQYPQEEGGSVEQFGPVADEKDAKLKLEQILADIKKVFGMQVKAIHRVQ
jgi:hypothetical protein